MPVREQASAAGLASGRPEIQSAAGVSIRDAIFRYAADQGAVLKWREDAVCRGDRRERIAATLRFMEYADHFRTELVSNLCEGNLIATGVWDSESVRRSIPAEILDGAKVDEIESQITILGRVIRDVRITAAPPASHPQASLRPPGRHQGRTHVQVNTVTELPPKSRGPQGGLTRKAAQKMADDIKSGAETPETLNALKRETLKARYGVKSADTAVRALNLAIHIAENSNFGK